jgi:hypothetical protein
MELINVRSVEHPRKCGLVHNVIKRSYALSILVKSHDKKEAITQESYKKESCTQETTQGNICAESYNGNSTNILM